MAGPRPDPLVRGDRAAGRRVRRARGHRRPPDRRRAAGAPRVPAAGLDGARDRGHRGPLGDHQRLPARARRAGAGRRGHRPGQRLDRLARARPLPRDHPARRARRRCCAGSRRSPPSSACARSRSTRSAMRDFTEDEVFSFCELARSTDYQVRFIEFMPLDGDRAWTPDQVLTGEEIRALIDERPPAGGAAARAARHRARLPVRATAPARSGSSTRSRSRSAPTATASALTAEGELRTCLFSASARPTCASRCAPAPPTPSSTQIVRDAVWRKELKHHVNEPGFTPPPRTMSAIGG